MKNDEMRINKRIFAFLKIYFITYSKYFTFWKIKKKSTENTLEIENIFSEKQKLPHFKFSKMHSGGS